MVKIRSQISGDFFIVKCVIWDDVVKIWVSENINLIKQPSGKSRYLSLMIIIYFLVPGLRNNLYHSMDILLHDCDTYSLYHFSILGKLRYPTVNQIDKFRTQRHLLVNTKYKITCIHPRIVRIVVWVCCNISTPLCKQSPWLSWLGKEYVHFRDD